MNATPRKLTSISVWLFGMIGLVAIMIVIGGATRLTNSGLSITEWKPITGALPPLSNAAWLSEFKKYKQIPEFAAEHPDMDLAAFKFIYFWEWGHRQLGRLIGLAYGLPFMWFLWRGKLSGERIKFFAILLLIGLQGAIGWWMVKSGLTDGRVDVSQYRLATHLGLAFLILGALFWLWRGQEQTGRRSPPVMKKRSTVLAVLVYLQIIAGAFVAGTHSGKTYNEWPLMDGDFVPRGYGIMSPFWKNLFETPAAIQFNHRILAYAIFAISIWVFISARKHETLRGPAAILLALVVWQVCLGIWTLLAVAPLSLSLLHQFSSIWVFLASIWLLRRSFYGSASVRAA